MVVETYETAEGKSPVKEYLSSLGNQYGNKLGEKTKKRILKNLDRLEKEGFALLRTSDIFSKVSGFDNIYALKTKFNGMEHRILCGKFRSAIYLLSGFSKKGQKLKDSDIETASERLKDLQRRIKN